MTGNFGISLLHMPPETTIPALSEVFNAVELPGILLSLDLALNKLPGNILFNGLLPVELTREIASQNNRIKQNFLERTAALLDTASQLGSNTVVVDFGLENCFADEARSDDTAVLIRQLSADLIRNNISMLLPVRVPFYPEANGSSEDYLNFLNKIMCPNIGFALNVYPHELAGRDIDFDEMLHWLRFNTRLVRFIYEPETGNRLVRKLLQPWFEIGTKYQWNCPYLVVPLMSRPETLENELVILREFFLTLNN